MNTPYAAALTDAATRSALTRKLLAALGATIGGILLLASFAVAVTVVSDSSQRLRDHGLTTVGTVTQLHEDSGRSSGSAEITYTVDGVQRTGHQDLGADASGYRLGQTVQVHYDPRHPARFAIDDEDNQPAWSVPAMIALLLGGAAGVSLGLLALVGWWRDRRLLAVRPWRASRLTIAERTTRTGKMLCVVELSNGDAPRLFLPSFLGAKVLPALLVGASVGALVDGVIPGVGGPAMVPSGVDLRLAGPKGRRAVIAVPDRGSGLGWQEDRIRLVALRGPRSRAQLTRWERRIRT